MTQTMPDHDNREAETGEKIENFFAFVQDVLDDPTILDRIPDKSTIDLTPLERKDPEANYITETRRFAVTVKRSPEPSGEGTGASPRSFVHGRRALKPTGNPVYAKRASGNLLQRDARKAVVVHPRRRSA